ncbi:MAG: hypothetical protein V7711_15565 [Pseudomonadales bacterium]
MELNWGAIGSIGEIIGAGAVFLTLAYLARQIKQTNGISRFNTTKDIMASFDNLNKMVVSDPSLRQVLNKTTELTADENEQLYTYANMYCNTWAICQTAYDNGQIDKDFYSSASQDVIFELKRWPRFESAVILWLDRYPNFKGYGVFSSENYDT